MCDQCITGLGWDDFTLASFIILMPVWAACSQGSRSGSPPLQGPQAHSAFQSTKWAGESNPAFEMALPPGDLGELGSNPASQAG